jgi:hypothetical protein
MEEGEWRSQRRRLKVHRLPLVVWKVPGENALCVAQRLPRALVKAGIGMRPFHQQLKNQDRQTEEVLLPETVHGGIV